MPSSDESASPPPEKKKKDKKEKKEKAKKEKKAKNERSRSPRRAAPEEEEEPAAPAPAVPRGVGGRSRSRDEPRKSEGANFAELFAAEFGKGGDGGKGEGKGKGKGKGGGKDGGKGGDGQVGEDGAPKEEPNFEASGLLAMEDNSKNGIPLKFTQPAEARLPSIKWRLYIFTKDKKDGAQKVVHIHRQPGYLFGKDRRVVDIPTDHPTCSKQQAVMHYRLVSGGQVKPYIMDLESTNGSFLNGEKLEPARYYEMREGDVLKFGMSSREFVLLHAGSANGMKIDPALLRSP